MEDSSYPTQAHTTALMSTYAHKRTEERGAVRCLRVSDDGARLYVGGEEACLAVYDAGSGDVIARTYSPRWPEKDKDGLGVPPVDDEDEDPEAAEKAAKAAEAKAEREAAMTPEELAAVLDAEAAAAEAKAKYLEEKRYRNKPKGFGGVNTVLCIAGGAGESGDLVFTGSRDCNVRRWAVSGDAPVVERVIPGHKAPVTAIAVSRDGSELVTGGARGDGELRHYRWQPVAGVDAEYVDGKLKSSAGSYVRVRTIRRGPEGFKETRTLPVSSRRSYPPTSGTCTPWATRAAWRLRFPGGPSRRALRIRISESRPTTRAASPPCASSRTSRRRDPTPPSASRRSRAPPPRARAEGSSPEAPTDASTCGPRRDTTTARGNSSRRKSPSGRRR